MRYSPVFRGCTGQDGAIYADELFRFDSDGSCRVYSLDNFAVTAGFTLDRVDVLKPHSNAVSFGPYRYSEDDAFPLLYTNIYNNCAREDDRREGTLCAYRLTRREDGFETKLVQVIRIGFIEELSLWKSLPDNGDVRSYGNLVCDPERNRLYAFVMRDKEHVTRYFEFDMPSPHAGEYDGGLGVNAVTLDKADILKMFDGPYSNYLQGACAYGGKLISVEGFNVKNADEVNKPRMQVIDMCEGRQIADYDLFAAGLSIEPELVDYRGDTLYYMDASGAVYIFDI